MAPARRRHTCRWHRSPCTSTTSSRAPDPRPSRPTQLPRFRHTRRTPAVPTITRHTTVGGAPVPEGIRRLAARLGQVTPAPRRGAAGGGARRRTRHTAGIGGLVPTAPVGPCPAGHTRHGRVEGSCRCRCRCWCWSRRPPQPSVQCARRDTHRLCSRTGTRPCATARCTLARAAASRRHGGRVKPLGPGSGSCSPAIGPARPLLFPGSCGPSSRSSSGGAFKLLTSKGQRGRGAAPSLPLHGPDNCGRRRLPLGRVQGGHGVADGRRTARWATRRCTACRGLFGGGRWLRL